jgi:hypothetical protein
MFADAPRSFFLIFLHETAEIMERTTISATPQLSFWLWSQQGWYKKIVAERYRVMMQQLQKAASSLQKGKVTSALEHMMMREEALAKKQGREPRIITQNMADEVGIFHRGCSE